MQKRLQFYRLSCTIMRISLVQILLAIACMGIGHAEDASGQGVLDNRISIELQNSSLRSALEQIEKAGKVRFMYHSELVTTSEKVSLEASDEPLGKVLAKLLSPFRIKYEVSGSQIILLEDKAEEKQDDGEARRQAPSAFIVTGTVLDENQQPMPGVNVIERGTTNGTTTDVNGKYTLDVANENAVLVFSFIGYGAQEVAVNSQTTITVAMTPDVHSLQEVVVVGYGTTNRKDLSTSIGTVKSGQLNERPTAVNVMQGLAGKVAGVNIMSNSGKPGGNPSIKIRGTGSINSSNAPLYVVDGIVGVDPLTIDPSVIESVDVLKDASSSAIYGSRGANGVIVITTRGGKKDFSEISFNNTVSFASLSRKVDVLDARESLEVFKRAYEYVPGRVAPHLDPFNVFSRKDDLFYADGTPRYNTDWQDEATRLAVSNIHTLSFSGGTENLTAMANVSYRNNEGIMLNSYRKQLNAFVNLQWKVKKWFDLQAVLNSGGSNENNVDRGTQNLNETRMMLEFLPFMPVKYADGTYSRKGDFPGAEDSENPVRMLNERKAKVGRTYTLANITGKFHITDKLDFITTFGGQTGAQYDFYWAGGDLRGWGETQQGVATRQHWNSGSWTNEDYFSYNNQFDKHALNVVAGASWYYSVSTYTKAGSEGYFDDFFQDNSLQTGTVIQVPASGMDENQLNSYYARVNYNFDDKYYAGASFRGDGSSRFGDNNKYGYFPSFSAAWRISREGFFDALSNKINDLKLRGSYGIVGNAEIGNYVTLDRLNNAQVVFNKQLESAVTLGALGNKNLRWEKSTQLDIGLDVDLYDSRIELIVDVYDKITKDLLYNKALPATTGYSGAYDNIGSIQNKGLEITVNSHNLRNSQLTWTTGVNFSMNRSKVLDLNDDIIYTWAGRIKEGRPLNEFYGYIREGTWGTDEADEAAKFGKKPGDLKFRDINPNGQKDSEDRTALGNGMPQWEANLNNTISYKGFSLFIDLQAMYGHSLMNFTRALMENRVTFSNSYAAVLDAWTPENQNSQVASLRLPGDGYENDTDSRVVEDGSFLRVRNVALSYRLNNKWLEKISLRNLLLSVNVENGLLFTRYKGFDPEASTFDGSFNQGVDMFQYPKPRTISLSINASF